MTDGQTRSRNLPAVRAGSHRRLAGEVPQAEPAARWLFRDGLRAGLIGPPGQAPQAVTVRPVPGPVPGAGRSWRGADSGAAGWSL